ncbi:hypothetical protein [Aliarcobacter butzleri]|uniref:hypothetical protein n=1 Tax=Aliarcobacter butzleri TaxID=28197 RepID=UPI00263E3DE8|nr:hypothetical protein [Aliarcobacter butzleri]MDN5089853.1 hypothetical protein [Aliarcobacter butzleri]
MKKIILYLAMGLYLSASEDFENKHLKCTLTYKDGETISERQAESLNKFKLDVLISKTDLIIGYKIYKYKSTDGGNDIYSDNYDNAYYIDYSKTIHIKRIINPIKEEKYKYDFSENHYYNELMELKHKKNIEKQREINVQEYNKQSEYICTEATLIEKIKYKYDNF